MFNTARRDAQDLSGLCGRVQPMVLSGKAQPVAELILGNDLNRVAALLKPLRPYKPRGQPSVLAQRLTDNDIRNARCDSREYLAAVGVNHPRGFGAAHRCEP